MMSSGKYCLSLKNPVEQDYTVTSASVIWDFVMKKAW